MEAEIRSVQYVCGLDDEQIVRVYLDWLCREKGFGPLMITQTMEPGQMPTFHIDNEMMDKDFIKQVLCSIVDKAKLESDPTNET